MQERDYNAMLQSRLKTELWVYRDWLFSQKQETILENCYQYATKLAIVTAIENHEFPQQKAKALLKSHAPLEEIYADFLKMEDSQVEDILKCAECRADKLLKREKAREAR